MVKDGPEVLLPHPDGLYNVQQTRRYLNPTRPLHPDSVYRIPEKMLPKTRVGPNRGIVLYKGSDILKYLGYTPAED